MKFLYKTSILVTVVISFLACVNTFSVLTRDSETELLNYMARSNYLLNQDPKRSGHCFIQYEQLINDIAKDYNIKFKSCLNEANDAKINADLATLEQRNTLENTIELTCELLTQCKSKKTVEKELQCYIEASSAGMQFMYVINANASQNFAALQKQYYLIQSEEYKCRNETKRNYEQESVKAYAGLNDCIIGNSEIVTEKTTTSTKTTTAEPEATTDQPTEPTEEPKTSNRPITTTKTSETTETNPEENTVENAI